MFSLIYVISTEPSIGTGQHDVCRVFSPFSVRENSVGPKGSSGDGFVKTAPLDYFFYGFSVAMSITNRYLTSLLSIRA